MAYTVESVEKNSIAAKAGLTAGDVIESVNGEPLKDYIDYVYFQAQSELLLSVTDKSGATRAVAIKKREDEELGLSFAEPPFGNKRLCTNNCVFCFVDQMPAGLRPTLSVKDDDWRLSFVMGNYITLTNVSQTEFERILWRKTSPLYISVHAADAEVRAAMMRNKNAGELMPRLRALSDAGIRFHTQIVLVPGMNDGEVLADTIRNLSELKGALSVAVVPVGMTKFREGLAELRPVDRRLARSTIALIERFQSEFLRERDTRFVFASDELYIRAALPTPDAEACEDFCQIENGVGLVAQFLDDAAYALEDARRNPQKKRYIAVTGVDFAPILADCAKRAGELLNADIRVVPIINRFFGETITVSGLLTGGDIADALRDEPPCDGILLPSNMLREGEDVFLDDMTTGELEKLLGTNIIVVCGGDGFIDAVAAK